jgi:diadenosine tetraphosphate (Ap4A) HIT family hydrolase
VQDNSRFSTYTISVTTSNETLLLQNQFELSCSSRVFMESATGIAMASLGQIVEGYTVVFGRGAETSLRDLTEVDCLLFLRFVGSVRERVEKSFGPTIMFEHGACPGDAKVSCGVNRMHIHIVPYTDRSLISEVALKFECVARLPAVEEMLRQLRAWDAQKPYFWIKNADGVFLFSYGAKRESQLMRQFIAERLGVPQQWNWREYPTQELAERVANTLRQAGISSHEKRDLVTM